VNTLLSRIVGSKRVKKRGGLGGVEKRKEILHLIRDKKPGVVYIQESKMEKVGDFLINSLSYFTICG
jgi:hypothetical protein